MNCKFPEWKKRPSELLAGTQITPSRQMTSEISEKTVLQWDVPENAIVMFFSSS